VSSGGGAGYPLDPNGVRHGGGGGMSRGASESFLSASTDYGGDQARPEKTSAQTSFRLRGFIGGWWVHAKGDPVDHSRDETPRSNPRTAWGQEQQAATITWKSWSLMALTDMTFLSDRGRGIWSGKDFCAPLQARARVGQGLIGKYRRPDPFSLWDLALTLMPPGRLALGAGHEACIRIRLDAG
jgi:hypothetical protein